MDVPDAVADEIVEMAVNQTGLTGVDREVWVEWAVRACREGAPYDPDVAARLAEELGGNPLPGLDLVMFTNGLAACRAGVEARRRPPSPGLRSVAARPSVERWRGCGGPFVGSGRGGSWLRPD